MRRSSRLLLGSWSLRSLEYQTSPGIGGCYGHVGDVAAGDQGQGASGVGVDTESHVGSRCGGDIGEGGEEEEEMLLCRRKRDIGGYFRVI